MAEHINGLGQQIGFPLPHWMARPRPPRSPMEGRFCRVEPIDPARHAADLHAANLLDREGRNWTYLPYGARNRRRSASRRAGLALRRWQQPATSRST